MIMEILKLPVLKTVWGPVDSLEDLKKHIAKSGQFFGQDLSGPACGFNSAYPCDKTLYEYMGWGLHKGIDIPCGESTEIYASHDGVVWKISETISQGLGIVLESLDEKFQTVYWHNKQNLVKTGDKVKAGELIAYSDNTGFSKGNHLHFELKLWKDNGYQAVDPLPYFGKKGMEFIKLDGGKDIWLVSNGKRSLVYNVSAFQIVGGNIDFVKVVTQSEFDAIPDSGVALAGIEQE